MVSFPLATFLLSLLFLYWLIERFGVYLRWLLLVLLAPVAYIGLLLLRDFLINL